MEGGYNGEDKGGDWVEKTLGWTVEIVRRPRKPAPKEVLMVWAEQWAKKGMTVDWQKLLPPQGFVVLPMPPSANTARNRISQLFVGWQ